MCIYRLYKARVTKASQGESDRQSESPPPPPPPLPPGGRVTPVGRIRGTFLEGFFCFWAVLYVKRGKGPIAAQRRMNERNKQRNKLWRKRKEERKLSLLDFLLSYLLKQ